MMTRKYAQCKCQMPGSEHQRDTTKANTQNYWDAALLLRQRTKVIRQLLQQLIRCNRQAKWIQPPPRKVWNSTKGSNSLQLRKKGTIKWKTSWLGKEFHFAYNPRSLASDSPNRLENCKIDRTTKPTVVRMWCSCVCACVCVCLSLNC